MAKRDAEAELGPVVRRLGSMWNTKIGTTVGVIWIFVFVVGLGIVGVTVALAAVMTGAAGVLFWNSGAGGAVTTATVVMMVLAGLVVGLIPLAGVLGFWQLVRTSLTIHENGFASRGTYFRREIIAPWADVVAVAPPRPGSRWITFHIHLADGRRINLDRLVLQATADYGPAGPVIRQHPDGEFFLAEYVRWCAAHGRQPSIGASGGAEAGFCPGPDGGTRTAFGPGPAGGHPHYPPSSW